jgi:carbonic anhydrase/acetyltransferase-like protein (isoleucine patch superfamily)
MPSSTWEIVSRLFSNGSLPRQSSYNISHSDVSCPHFDAVIAMAQIVFWPDLVHRSAWIAPGAIVIGDVSIGEESSIWFNSVLRGDTDPIRVGARTNIQDGCILHADPGFPCTIGDGVTVGHGAIVHGATIENDVLIGMRAVVMNGARIGLGSIIGTGTVVTERMQIPARSMILGLPGKVARQTTEEELERIRATANRYVERAKMYRD